MVSELFYLCIISTLRFSTNKAGFPRWAMACHWNSVPEEQKFQWTFHSSEQIFMKVCSSPENFVPEPVMLKYAIWSYFSVWNGFPENFIPPLYILFQMLLCLNHSCLLKLSCCLERLKCMWDKTYKCGIDVMCKVWICAIHGLLCTK